ncbi:protein FAR1-RELATED SEQUENCE 5-like [Spinacia oleracea]|uniref:Protein FAR1-RELATED SEQUENCE 5-like n=1 Tax=Spinacia oleracea TaxID=3562 RepID=A0ABM3RHP0_SPIOL|nr:protein FAR1-RELATED SEQUENCE 5-like [Spinacia oleracea]
MENLIRSVIQSTQRIQVPVEPDIQDATMEDVLNNCIENNALAEEREEEELTNEIEAEEQHIISDSKEPDQDIVGTLMGYTAEAVEELLGFYEKHASAIGFSIRIGNTRFKVGTRIVLEKTFLCSAAGVTNNGKNKKKKVQTVVPVVPKKERKPRQVPITRTRCRACLRVKMNSEGRYAVVNHVIIHNHELTRSQWHYLHRSERKITEEKGEAIETMQKFGLSSTTSFNYMEIEAGGEENLGHSKKDHLNYCTRLKMKQIGGDAQAVTDIIFGALKRDPNFKKTFNYCLYKCVTVVEFETNWRSMLQTYELIGEEWFTNVYDLREKWCPALSKDFFSAGILSSQRSESTNHSIGFIANRTTSLTDFYRLFKGTIQRWRSTEKQAEFTCSESVASSALSLSGLLKHASEAYEGNTQFYVVSIDEEPWSAQRVTYIHESQTVSCTCKNFEASGWLCYHCIRILHLHLVNQIPKQYIKKRWTNSGKSSVWNKLENENPEEVQYTPWRQTMARKYYNLVLKSQSNEETRTLMEDGYAASVSLVDELLASLNLSNTEDASTTQTSATAAPETSTTRAPETNTTPTGTHDTTASDTSVQQAATSSEPATNTSTEPPMVLDPAHCTTKGRNKRPRGPLEKKKKGKTTASPTTNFGTITPNLRLF